MRALAGLNAALALICELALLAAAVAVGLALPAATPLRFVAAVLLPAVVIALWGLFVAPRASRRMAAQPRAVLQAGLFAVAVLALASFDLVGWAAGFALLAAGRLVLGGALGRV